MDLVNEGLIFAGQNTENLFQHGRFYTKYVSEIESDPVGVFKLCREALADLGLDEVDVRHAAHQERRPVRLLEAIHLLAKLLVKFGKLLECK